MNRPPRFTRLALVAVAAFVASCVDAPVPTAPEAEANASLLASLSGGGQDVQVLERSVPLGSDEQVSRVIGPLGGVIHLPEAGLTVAFPPGAVRSRTRITVTAPAGNLVGYHFAPHGLVFRAPVAAVQDLTKTKAALAGSLLAAYFEGSLAPTVSALELLDLRLLGGLKAGAFTIEHFSGYVVATD